LINVRPNLSERRFVAQSNCDRDHVKFPFGLPALSLLGHYVGPEALAAVTLMLPFYMLIVALATLVSSGMSSLLARHLGGHRLNEARAVFAGAHGLALFVVGVLILLFVLFGRRVVTLARVDLKPLPRWGRPICGSR